LKVVRSDRPSHGIELVGVFRIGDRDLSADYSAALSNPEDDRSKAWAALAPNPEWRVVKAAAR